MVDGTLVINGTPAVLFEPQWGFVACLPHSFPMVKLDITTTGNGSNAG